jgi:hypothetical protein
MVQALLAGIPVDRRVASALTFAADFWEPLRVYAEQNLWTKWLCAS